MSRELNFEAQHWPNPVGRANVRSRHAGCSAAFARAAVAPLTPVAHLWALGQISNANRIQMFILQSELFHRLLSRIRGRMV